MQKFLFIINAPPYGSEYFLSGLRLASQIQEQYPSVAIQLFLMSDAVVAGIANQAPNEGIHIQQRLELLATQGAEIKLCKTCTNARGITTLPLVKGVEIGTLVELAEWSLCADKVFNF